MEQTDTSKLFAAPSQLSDTFVVHLHHGEQLLLFSCSHFCIISFVISGIPKMPRIQSVFSQGCS